LHCIFFLSILSVMFFSSILCDFHGSVFIWLIEVED
jgi:hypothetical protein